MSSMSMSTMSMSIMSMTIMSMSTTSTTYPRQPRTLVHHVRVHHLHVHHAHVHHVHVHHVHVNHLVLKNIAYFGCLKVFFFVWLYCIGDLCCWRTDGRTDGRMVLLRSLRTQKWQGISQLNKSMRLHKCTGGERCDGGDSGIYAPTALCDTALCDTALCNSA